MRSMKIVVLSIVLSLVLAAGVSAQTTITYSAWGNELELAVERALIEAFEKANPDSKLS